MWFVVAAGGCFDAALCADSDPANPAPQKKLALLIGCTDYSQHKTWKLEGPVNDVNLLKTVLTDHFDFADSQITTLVEGIDESHIPTKANINRQFDRLASVAGRDDQIVILLSGHGSQQPEQDSVDSDDHKLDGLDEIFLPADTGIWDEAQQTVTNVILDHELRRWVDRIVELAPRFRGCRQLSLRHDDSRKQWRNRTTRFNRGAANSA